MASLFLHDEKTGASWPVWPVQQRIPNGAVHETGSYLFELEGAGADASILLIDDTPLEALRSARPDRARWRWSPGFYAGAVEAELRLPGRAPRRFEIVTDPDRRKLTRLDFDAMVREILDDTFALFSLSGFRQGIARNTRRPPPVARLEFLRSRIAELESAVAAIERNPRRMLTAAEVPVPYHQAHRATGLEVLRSFRSGRVLRETGQPSRLPAALKGSLPEHIRIRRRFTSLDLPEHRQMGACLRFWADWLQITAGLLEKAGRKDGDPDLRRNASMWSWRCRGLARRVGRLATAEPFVEAGDARPQLTLSAVFRRDPAYRRFYRLWQDMNRGIAAVFGDFLNLPLARTYELYELWCFLRLVRAAADAFGGKNLELHDLFIKDERGGLTLATGTATLSVGSGWKLCFQKQYREFWVEADGQGSYSRTMTPDIVAIRGAGPEGEHAKNLIVLDAKYRIEDGLNDALNSIHTYRDALVREADTGKIEGIVRAAYLLAPYLPELSEGYRSTPLPGRLFHPDYRSEFQFGAVTLRPGMDLAGVIRALKTVIADAAQESRL